MFTDIKGFTSKTSSKSRKQVEAMLDLHDKLVRPVFREYGGRVIKTIGDAFLAIFDSPTDAVQCGMEIQKVLEKHNKESKEEDQIEVRVGINSGEVHVKENDVFGEAVNIASRIEGIAKPGEIYFTEAVFLSMNKREVPSAEIGYRHLKGIPSEIKVYKVLSEDQLKKNRKPAYGEKESVFAFLWRKKWWVLLVLILLSIFKNAFIVLVILFFIVLGAIEAWKRFRNR
jgi:class 3 adenylate cyclase